MLIIIKLLLIDYIAKYYYIPFAISIVKFIHYWV